MAARPSNERRSHSGWIPKTRGPTLYLMAFPDLTPSRFHFQHRPPDHRSAVACSRKPSALTTFSTVENSADRNFKACFLRYLPVALTRAQLNVQAPALPACLHRHWRGDARRSWRKSQCHQIMHGMKEIRHTQALQAFFRKVDQGIGPGH